MLAAPVTRRHVVRRIVPILPLIGSLLLAAGCGDSPGANPPRLRVSGRITLDGQPVPAGLITFVPLAPTQLQAQGVVRDDGTYVIEAKDGPSPGEYKVEILCDKKTGRRIKSMASPAPDGMMDERIPVVPSKYNTHTVLKKTIAADDNVLDFDLTSK